MKLSIKSTVTATAILAALTYTASAMSGNDWADISDEARIGYALGVADTSLNVCVPDATGRQLADIGLRYIKQHPEIRHYKANRLLVSAFNEAWPCK